MSYSICKLSQNFGSIEKNKPKRKAVSAVMGLLRLTISLMRLGGTSMSAASCLGASLLHASGPWTARLGFDWHAAQDRIPAGSVATESYTLWHGFVSYKQKLSGTTLNWFGKLDNLSNQWAYSATSILTSTAPGKSPLPGRSLKLGVMANF